MNLVNFFRTLFASDVTLIPSVIHEMYPSQHPGKYVEIFFDFVMDPVNPKENSQHSTVQ